MNQMIHGAPGLSRVPPIRYPRLSVGAGQLILLGIYGLAISLLLGRGTYNIALGFTGLGLIGQAVAGPGWSVTSAYRVLLAAGLTLFFQGVMAARGLTGTSPYAVLWCLLATLGILQLGRQTLRGHLLAMTLILVAIVIMNLLFDAFWHRWPNDGKAGMMSNIHYLSQYSVMTLPILLFYATLVTRTRVRALLLLTLLGDVWLLLESRSRPGFMALLAAALVVVPFVAGSLRWKVVAIMAAIMAGLYFGNVAQFSTRVNDLAANFTRDERWDIWLEAIRLQQASSWPQWLFGHGFEQFIAHYRAIADAHGTKPYFAPHNFVMELLYSHGWLGLLLVTGLYGGFFYRLAVTTLSQSAGTDRRVGMLVIAIATAHLVHGFFTIPFLSRDYLLPFSFVLGAGFLYLDRAARTG